MIEMDPTQKLTEKQMRIDFELINTDQSGSITVKGKFK